MEEMVGDLCGVVCLCCVGYEIHTHTLTHITHTLAHSHTHTHTHTQVLELISVRDSHAVYAAGGLQASLTLVTTGGDRIFKDTLLSCGGIISKCCK